MIREMFRKVKMFLERERRERKQQTSKILHFKRAAPAKRAH